MRFLLMVFFFFFFGFAFGQKELAQWRFGYRSGLDFLGSSPIVMTSSSNCYNSSSTISDSLGNLLFYIQEGGMIVNNKTHAIMANGSNIGGDGGPQSGWIIPKGINQYYVVMHHAMNYFAPWPFPPMTYYAIVDMNLAAGLGSVIVTSQPISASGTAMVSKMAVTRHCNGTDYWILRHSGGYPGANFYFAYLVSGAGISTNPVITTIGSNQPQANAMGLTGYSGMHKFSPNGRKIAATFPDRTVEIYDFNTSTGQLSNVYKLDSVIAVASPTPMFEANARGIEFSPDGSKLYVSYINKHPHLCQFDLSLPNISAIRASKTVISTDTITDGSHCWAPQLAYDGKIYIADKNHTEHLSVVQNPNLAGLTCNFSPQAVFFGTTATSQFTAQVGNNLPNCINTSFEQKPLIPPITSGIICGVVNFSAPVLSAIAGYSVSSYAWNFNDPLSGSNTSTLSQPTHTFSANGSYTVKLALNYYPCGTDTLKQVININGLPQLGHGGRNPICKNESTILNFTGANSYTLNTQSLPQNTVQIQPTVTTVCTLTGTDNSGCSAKKTFTVSVLPCTAVSEEFANDELKVYPNPNSGRFTLETKTSGELLLYNSQGQSVFRKHIAEGQSEMDLGQVPKGIYILTWQSQTSWLRLKLVVE